MTRDSNTANNGFAIDRRRAMAAGLALGAATLAPVVASAARLDPANPEHARLIYRKMRYRSDSGLLFAWVKGPHMALVGADLTPMYGINLGSIQRVTQRADGGFDVRQLEISFSTDPDTGKRLTSYRNPVTGETLPVSLRRPAPSTVSYSRDNELHAPPTWQGAKFEVLHYPVAISEVGGDLYLRDRTRATITQASGAVRTLNEISTFRAPSTAALDPAVPSVDAGVQSNDVTSWPSWLKMGATPGVLGLYAVGGKAARFADMPSDWLDMLHEVWPNIAADPIAALDRTAES